MNAFTKSLLTIVGIAIVVTVLTHRCAVEDSVNWGDAPTWLGALGGLLVVIVAVWGDELKAALVGPRLHLHLADPRGEPLQIGGLDGRYFHVKVTNDRPWSPALNTRVLLSTGSAPRERNWTSADHCSVTGLDGGGQNHYTCDRAYSESDPHVLNSGLDNMAFQAALEQASVDFDKYEAALGVPRDKVQPLKPYQH